MAQPPIGDYALLSDRQTAALVAHGSIDWLCVPRFDSPAVFARLLGDDDNGYWRVLPVERDGASAVETGRGYRDGSFVLDTHWSTGSGAATTTDFLAHTSGDVASTSAAVVRQVHCTRGRVDVQTDLVMRFDYGLVVPWVRRRSHCDDVRGADRADGVGRTTAAGAARAKGDGGTDEDSILHAVAGAHSLVLQGPRLTGADRAHRGRFQLEAGDTLTWTLAWQPAHLEVWPTINAATEVDRVLDDWRRWRTSVPCRGPYATPIADSLAVLRALTLHRTGGIVAAATTSLPEEIGGERNWDYRYTWLRDSAFTIQALASHGHVHVALHWRDWLLRAIAGDPRDLQIMYAVDGSRQLPESELAHLSGYRGSTPVRIGNGAYTQYQADVVGEVMIALAALRDAGQPDDRFSWRMQRNLLQLLEGRLDVPDRGIWEVRGDPHRFTHGRVLMWAAFDRGIRAVEEHGLDGPVDRWRRIRAALHDDIWVQGVRDGAFVQHDETDAVDAALLQIPQTGFVAADSPVMLATVARIEEDLVDAHGFVRRYVPDGSDGVGGGEGAFLMCTFWLVEQYARSGRRDEAVALMDRLLAIRNDVGLLAEEYDARCGELLGNYPQAFSHLALIRAAEALS